MGRPAWTWAGPLAALTLAVAAGGIALVLLTTGGASRDRDFAQFVPADVDLYVTLNLDPDHAQSVLRNDFIARWEQDAGANLAGDLLDSLASGFGVSYDDDIAPWLGNDIAFVGLAGFFSEPRGFLMARVADQRAAGDFLDYVEALGRAEPDSYRDADILTLGDGLALGLTGDFMLLASSRSALIGALRDLQTPPSAALDTNAAYREARAALPGDSFLFAFWQADATLVSAMSALGVPAIDSAEPPYIAASASFAEEGLRVEVATPASGLPFETATSLRSLDLLPSDTIAAASFSGVPDAWEILNSTLGPEAIQEILSEAEQTIGLDIERDVIDSLAGEVAAALLPSDFRIDADGNWEGTLKGLLFAEIGSDAPQATLDGLLILLEALGVTVSRENIGGREFVFIPLGELDPALDGYELGYFVDDGMFALGSDREAALRIGAEDSLRGSAQFARVADILPEAATGYVYIDIEGALDMAEGSLASAFSADRLSRALFDAMEAAAGFLPSTLGANYQAGGDDGDVFDALSWFDALDIPEDEFGDEFANDKAGFSEGSGMGLFDSLDTPPDASIEEFMRALLSATDFDDMEPVDDDEFMRVMRSMVSIGAGGGMEPLDDEFMRALLGAASLGAGGDMEWFDGGLLQSMLGDDGGMEPFGADMPEEAFDTLMSGLLGAASLGSNSAMALLEPFSALLITSHIDGDISRMVMALTLRQ